MKSLSTKAKPRSRIYQEPGMELEDILCEQLFLQLPMQRVCSEACEGICPVCGMNRNETSCRCVEAQEDDRWSALRICSAIL